jgi:hypothetical protein
MAVAGRRQHGVRLAGFDRSLGAHAVRARRDTLHRAMTARPSLAAPAIRAISRKLAAIIGPGEAREPAARAASEMSHAPGARSDRRASSRWHHRIARGRRPFSGNGCDVVPG